MQHVVLFFVLCAVLCSCLKILSLAVPSLKKKCVLLTVLIVSLREFNYMTSKYACSSGLKVTLDASVLCKLNVKRVKLFLPMP